MSHLGDNSGFKSFHDPLFLELLLLLSLLMAKFMFVDLLKLVLTLGS